MWELELFDLGEYSGDLDAAIAPEVGTVLVDGAIEMLVTAIRAIDSDGRTAQVDIEYV